jgi:hypothetical protein
VARRDPWEFQRWALTAAIEHELEPAEAHVLIVVAVHVDPSGETYVSLATLAAAVRRGERQTTDALASLKRRGLIERRGRGPGRTPVTRLLAAGLTSGQPRPSDSRETATQRPDSRPAATDDSRPAAPLTRGQPRPELPLEPPLELHPPAPAARGSDILPPRPSGNRERDRTQWNREALAWAARRGVTAAPGSDWKGCEAVRKIVAAANGNENGTELRALASSPPWHHPHVHVDHDATEKAA